jgi:hypothetical protein
LGDRKPGWYCRLLPSKVGTNVSCRDNFRGFRTRSCIAATLAGRSQMNRGFERGHRL